MSISTRKNSELNVYVGLCNCIPATCGRTEGQM